MYTTICLEYDCTARKEHRPQSKPNHMRTQYTQTTISLRDSVSIENGKTWKARCKLVGYIYEPTL